LGSIAVVPGPPRLAGLPNTRTGTVIGWNSFNVKLTVKSPVGIGTVTAQGVVQPGPIEVAALAPGGFDSSPISIIGGLGADEQPARQHPANAMGMIRRMIHCSPE
jgi:hypothetical protein